MSAISLIQPDRDLFSWPQYWAACFGPAPFLPMSREEMDQLGWDSCDIILVTGDAYVDHPSFGMAICGRMLEAQGFRVGIISQPDWNSKDDFMRLGKPNLFFGVTAGNMDSMINRYTADRKLRHDDAYTAGNVAGKRPDRATLVYTQRCKEAWKDVPVILGGIEASLRRTAHYDYWSDTVPGFTGVISDLGGPTANMYMLRCKSPRAEQTCRRLSCVYPDICPHMDTNHEPTINLYRRARELKGIKKILIASGVRYDIAVEDPRYIKELATHHVGGYLKIAPEHTEEGPLSKMMKPGMGSYDRFKELFDTYSKQAGKEQYLIPYFISAHPGTRDEDMVNLALWLKKHRFRLDQVQNFYPSPLANSTTMYYTGKNPLGKIGYKSEEVVVPKGDKQRRLHKALLRYHDPANWPLIRQALEAMGKKHLIGSRRDCLVPAPTLDEMREARRQNRHTRPALTKHTPIAHQRQTPAAAGAKKRVKPKAVSR